jgi:hypothetical protein
MFPKDFSLLYNMLSIIDGYLGQIRVDTFSLYASKRQRILFVFFEKGVR